MCDIEVRFIGVFIPPNFDPYEHYCKWFIEDKKGRVHSDEYYLVKLSMNPKVEGGTRETAHSILQECAKDSNNEEAIKAMMQVPFEPLSDYYPNASRRCRGWAFTTNVTYDFIDKWHNEGTNTLTDEYLVDLLKHGNHAGRHFAARCLVFYRPTYPGLMELIETYDLAPAPDEDHLVFAKVNIKMLREKLQQEKAIT